MAHQPGHEDDVTVALADHLVGDVCPVGGQRVPGPRLSGRASRGTRRRPPEPAAPGPAAGSARAARVRPGRARSRAPRSSSVRSSRYAPSASACLPLRYSASIRVAHSRSRSGCLAVSASSSAARPPRSPGLPRSSRAWARDSTAASLSSPRRADSIRADGAVDARERGGAAPQAQRVVVAADGLVGSPALSASFAVPIRSSNAPGVQFPGLDPQQVTGRARQRDGPRPPRRSAAACAAPTGALAGWPPPCPPAAPATARRRAGRTGRPGWSAPAGWRARPWRGRRRAPAAARWRSLPGDRGCRTRMVSQR